jgi:hypothetical protein
LFFTVGNTALRFLNAAKFPRSILSPLSIDRVELSIAVQSWLSTPANSRRSTVTFVMAPPPEEQRQELAGDAPDYGRALTRNLNPLSYLICAAGFSSL